MAKRQEGKGTVHVTTDAKGQIREAEMAASTGSKILDAATIKIARAHWQGPPRTTANIPVEYRLPPIKVGATTAKSNHPGWKIPRHSYPYAASDAYEQGTCTVRATTDEKGQVKEAVVIHSSGHKRLDADAVGNALNNWAGPASASIEMPVVYRLDTDVPVVPPSADGKTWHTPRPYYPAGARATGGRGQGLIQITTNENGRVVRAVILASTGNTLLDENTVNYALARWSGPPNGRVRVPFAYLLR